MSNIETIQQLYADVGRGDIAAILSRLSEAVEFDYGLTSTDVPWLQPRRGRAEITKFFEAFDALQINSLKPKIFFETGLIVLVLVDEDMTVKSTGKRVVEEDQVHIWHFDVEGQIVRHRARVDTYLHWSAQQTAVEA